MALKRNIAGVGDRGYADTILTALQQPTYMNNSRPIYRIQKRIGALDSDTAGLLIVGGLFTGAMMKKNGMLSGKGKRKKSLLPLLLVGGGLTAYFLLSKKGGDSESADLVVTPGIAVLSNNQREAVFARAATWVNPTGTYYPGIYRDVLNYVLPQYKTTFDSMNDTETAQLYSLVIDHPTGVIQANEPALYDALQAIKSRYNFKFY